MRLHGDDVQITVEEKEQVAIGGWATVYRAKIVPIGETIAIKQVKETKPVQSRDHTDMFS